MTQTVRQNDLTRKQTKQGPQTCGDLLRTLHETDLIDSMRDTPAGLHMTPRAAEI